jgi:hypothetical protein
LGFLLRLDDFADLNTTRLLTNSFLDEYMISLFSVSGFLKVSVGIRSVSPPFLLSRGLSALNKQKFAISSFGYEFCRRLFLYLSEMKVTLGLSLMLSDFLISWTKSSV